MVAKNFSRKGKKMSETVNLKITAYLVSPLSGEAPPLDALLTYQLAFLSNEFKSKKYTKQTPLSEFKRLKIPLCEYDINGEKINTCSDPIYKIEYEWHEKIAKRFETDKLTLYLNEKYRKNFNTGSGIYKSLFKSIHVKKINKIIWFARGGLEGIKYILSKINSLGYHRKIGMGIVAKWKVEQIKYSNFITIKNGNNKILMKTIPYGDGKNIENLEGYRIGFGAYKPPYWHPENQFKILIPC